MNSPLIRHSNNPILDAARVPHPATLIFNAGVTHFKGRYVMAFRNDYGGTPGQNGFKGTNIALAYSDNGIDWIAESKPWIEWKTHEIQRVYDPRLTVLEGRCYLCFAVDTRHGIRGGIAVTDDLESWEVLSLSAPDNRNMVLFPEKIRGKFARLERPFPIYGRGWNEFFDIWYADSPDAQYWGNHQIVLDSESVPWSNCKIGPGAPPIKTHAGWLTTYHAVKKIDEDLPAWHKDWKKVYSMGLMLLDLEQPWIVKSLSSKPLLEPEADYELNGFRGHVIFPGGMILEPDGEVKIYYGAADTVTCLATAHINDLIDFCQTDPATVDLHF